MQKDQAKTNDQAKTSVAIGLLAMGIAMGQAFAPRGTLKFEVTSIKRTAPGTQPDGVRPSPGGRRYSGKGLPLRSYLYVAYQVREEQIVGGPNWVSSDLYDLNAEAEKPSSIEDLHIMLQNALTDAFKLKFHFEKKEMPAYVLSVDKGGPKSLKPHSGASGGDVVLDRNTERLNHVKFTAHCASLDFFTWRLSPWLERPIVNQTGLNGCFDFDLSYTDDLPKGIESGQSVNGTPVDTYGPTLFQALQSQLGLKLEGQRAAVETMVIDQAERPEAE